jgi:hypothetical protein
MGASHGATADFFHEHMRARPSAANRDTLPRATLVMIEFEYHRIGLVAVSAGMSKQIFTHKALLRAL